MLIIVLVLVPNKKLPLPTGASAAAAASNVVVVLAILGCFQQETIRLRLRGIVMTLLDMHNPR